MENLDRLRWINKGAQYTNIDVSRAEHYYSGAVYIAELSIIGKHGWTEEPVSVFWNPNPNMKLGHKHYFGLFQDHQGWWAICDATSVTNGVWPGLEADSGEIIFSRFHHDYRACLTDRAIWIDGGREYTRHGGKGKSVSLKVVGPDFVVIDDESEHKSEV